MHGLVSLAWQPSTVMDDAAVRALRVLRSSVLHSGFVAEPEQLALRTTSWAGYAVVRGWLLDIERAVRREERNSYAAAAAILGCGRPARDDGEAARIPGVVAAAAIRQTRPMG